MIPAHIEDELKLFRYVATRMLFRAICDYVNYRKWSRRRVKNRRDRTYKAYYEEARSWIFDVPAPTVPEIDMQVEDDIPREKLGELLTSMDQLMSFDTLCEVLGWDPNWIRSNIDSLSTEDLLRVGKKNGFM
jgi:hypothetical protein